MEDGATPNQQRIAVNSQRATVSELNSCGNISLHWIHGRADLQPTAWCRDHGVHL